MIKLHWESDWNGEEVGFPESEVVGLYSVSTADQQRVFFYIDMETSQVLSTWGWQGDEL